MFEKLGVRNNLIKLVKSNFSLYRLFLIFIIICYEFACLSVRTVKENPNIKNIIVMRDVSLLLLLPLIISLFILLINCLKNKIINKKMSEKYYRNILNKISCTELTYVDDNNVEIKKDIIATILVLNLKKKVKFENNRIVIIDTETSKLNEHEEYVLKKLIAISRREKHTNYSILDIIKEKRRVKNEFESALLNDLKNSGVIEEKSSKTFEKKYGRIKKIIFTILILILLFVGSGDPEIAVCLSFGTLLFSFIWCLIKIPRPKKKWGPIKLILFYMTCFYVLPFIIVGILMLPMIAEEFQEEVVSFLKYVFMAIAVIIICIESYIILNNKKLTEKGKDIKKKLCGLKMYLNDFSTMKFKDLNEIGLWDEYIIYAVVLNENKKITKKIWKMFKNTIGNN